VREAYLSESHQDQYLAWSLAEAVGIDLWEDAFARLEREPIDSMLYFQLMRTDDLSRVRRVIEFAEQRLPLTDIATGPEDAVGFGPEYKAHDCLDFILQEMKREGVFSDPLIAVGLRSPVIRNRNMAAAALEAHPVSAWGERIREALHKTVNDECSEELRERFRGLINRSL
ncbi:MAG TPA: limonene hydroxylase, partial [Blastocatellia bacterium]|nr:limonene hydroxylase [Blastocatellia bacterium]